MRCNPRYGHLGQAFGGAHDIVRIDRFVRGDKDKALRADSRRGFGRVHCARHIGQDGFANVTFHQGNMLQRRRVDDDIRLCAREHVADTVHIANIAQSGRVPVGGQDARQFHVD